MKAHTDRTAKEQHAAAIVERGHDETSFFKALRARLDERGVVVPGVTIDWRALCHDVDATTASDVVPSLLNTLKSARVRCNVTARGGLP